MLSPSGRGMSRRSRDAVSAPFVPTPTGLPASAEEGASRAAVAVPHRPVRVSVPAVAEAVKVGTLTGGSAPTCPVKREGLGPELDFDPPDATQ